MPIPTHFWGLTLNDLGLTLDKRSVNYGEAQGLPFVPVGLYDWSGRLVDTLHTDFNGLYEALEPSTDTYNCPVPAGPCPNMYRFVGNDPGQPGALNPDYNSEVPNHRDELPGMAGPVHGDRRGADPGRDDRARPGHHRGQPDRVRPRRRLLRSCSRWTARSSARTPRRTQRVVTVSGFGFGATAGTLKLGTTNRDRNELVRHQDRVHGAGEHDVRPGGSEHHRTVPARRTSTGSTIQVLDATNSSTPGTSPTNPLLAEVGPTKHVQDDPGGTGGGPADHRSSLLARRRMAERADEREPAG